MDCQTDNTSLIPLSKVVGASVIDTYEDWGKMREKLSFWAVRGLRQLQSHSLPPKIKKVVLIVNKNTQTATLPLDFNGEKYVGIIDSRGHKIPLKLNTKLTDITNVEVLEEQNKCNVCCQDKNICNDLCVTQETNLIVINGSTYEEIITKKLYPNGDYYLETITPFYDIESETVIYPSSPKREFIVNFDLLPCGCLESSETNIFNLRNFCSDVYCNYYAPCEPCCNAEYGGYKIYPDSGLIQFDRYYKFDKVYLEYNGFIPKVNGQYMVPAVAFETLVEWTKFMSIDGKRNVPNVDKKWRFDRYVTEKGNMERVLGRFDLSIIMQSINKLPKFDIDYGDEWYGCFGVSSNSVAALSTESTAVSTTTIINNGTTSGRASFVLSVKVDGNPGSPVAGQTSYQNNLLKNALDIKYIIAAKAIETIADGDFTFDPNAGTIDRSPNIWISGDSLIIHYSKNL